MSVLMTAGKKARETRAAAAKLKKKQKSAPAFFTTDPSAPTAPPPTSSAKTAVWYWNLDGVLTTIMYNKESNEVWCNGYILETVEGFADDMDVGGVIDFSIYVQESNIVHQGRIRRLLAVHTFVYQLYVDGYPITEHTVASSSSRYSYPEDLESVGAGYAEDVPPSYEDSVASSLIFEPKKTK